MTIFFGLDQSHFIVQHWSGVFRRSWQFQLSDLRSVGIKRPCYEQF